MPNEPMPQGLDIPDKETAIERLDELKRSIMRLRDDIPAMAEMAANLKQQLEGMEQDHAAMLFLVDRLLARQQTWQEWLGNRLTLLVNLKTYLELNNNAEEDGSA